jgi:heme-degrading monooxygenase HmoA
MFARVGVYQSEPGYVDEVAKSFENRREVQELPGFVDAYVLIDRNTGKAMTLTFWESEQAVNESAEAAKELRDSAVQEFRGSVESVETYEVTLHVKEEGQS